MTAEPIAVAAGHICLDVIPSLDHLKTGDFAALFHPGRLLMSGPAAFSTGGPVSNTGLALQRLGISTRLAAKVGADPFGRIVRELVEKIDPGLAAGIVIDPVNPTSYSMIISPPGVDRIFMHCPGANDAFGPEDLGPDLLEAAALFHFGYPPIMRRMMEQDGAELVEIFRRARAAGAATSLDMAFPDPLSPAGRVDWRAVLRGVLPLVDIFAPSFDELLFMLRPETYACFSAELRAGESVNQRAEPDLLDELSAELLNMGAGLVLLKLGDQGLYLHGGELERLERIPRAVLRQPAAWVSQRMWVPCFEVKVAGTTGSGDATIAGFLAAMLRGFGPEDALTMAVAVGACNVEAPDALSGLRSWDDTLRRAADPAWKRLPVACKMAGWDWDFQARLYRTAAQVEHL